MKTEDGSSKNIGESNETDQDQPVKNGRNDADTGISGTDVEASAETNDASIASNGTEAEASFAIKAKAPEKSSSDEEENETSETPEDNTNLKVSVSYNNRNIDLNASGEKEITANWKSSFIIHVSADFSAGYNKKINIHLPYGMTWNLSDGDGFAVRAWNTVDKSAAWYQELTSITDPDNQASSDDKPLIYHFTDKNGNAQSIDLGNGTVSFNFKGTTQHVAFDMECRTLGNAGGTKFNTNLSEISDAITVSETYDKGEGEKTEPVSRSLVLNKINITNLPALSVIKTNDYKDSADVDEDGNVVVTKGSDSGHLVRYYGGFNTSGESHLLTSYYIRFLVTKGAEFKEIFQDQYTPDYFGTGFKAPVKQEENTTYTDSDGNTQTVPEGYSLFTFETYSPTPTTWDTNDNRLVFDPVWDFSKFDSGDRVSVRMVDIGAKFYDQEKSPAECSYVKYDRTKLDKVKADYLIEDPVEKVFIQAGYSDRYKNEETGKNEFVWQKNTNAGNVYLGAPGFLHTQEREIGSFVIGNRGTGDSVPKTITIRYDENNTNDIGVTAQYIPGNWHIKGITDSEITDFKYWIRNVNDGTVKGPFSYDPSDFYTDSSVNYHQRQYFRLSREELDQGWYLHEIKYNINTIPKQSYLGVNGYIDNPNYPYRTFPYLGFVLTNDKKEKTFVCSVTVEDASSEKNKNNFRSGKVFTGTNGKSYIQPFHTDYMANNQDILIGGTHSGNMFGIAGPYGERAGWYGSSNSGAVLLNRLWVISPNGTDITNIHIQVGNSGRLFTGSTDITGDLNISEIFDSDVLEKVRAKEGFQNARVWCIDFRGIKKEDDENRYFRDRVFGPQFYSNSKEVPSTYPNYWHNVGSIYINYNAKSLFSDTINKVYSPLVYAEVDQDTAEYNSNGEKIGIDTHGWSSDEYNLTGNGNRVFRMGSITIKPQTNLTIGAGLKDESSSLYRTYDLSDPDLLVGLKKVSTANSTVNYKISVVNKTGGPIDRASIYFPVPKKGEYWGQNVNPKGAFTFNMELQGDIASSLPEGYTVQYASVEKPVTDYTLWGTSSQIVWKDAGEISDWKTVNLVRIIHDSTIASGAEDEISFDLIASPDAELEQLDVWRVAYQYVLPSATGWNTGDAVGATVREGTVTGLAFVDENDNGIKDATEENASDITYKIYSLNSNGNRLNLLDEQSTREDGTYVFNNLRKGAKFEIEATLPKNKYTGVSGIVPDESVTAEHKNSYSKSGDSSRIVTAKVDELSNVTTRDIGVLVPGFVVEKYLQDENGNYPDKPDSSVRRIRYLSSESQNQSDGDYVTVGQTVAVYDSDKKVNDPRFEFDDTETKNVLEGVVPSEGDLHLKLYFKRGKANINVLKTDYNNTSEKLSGVIFALQKDGGDVSIPDVMDSDGKFEITADKKDTGILLSDLADGAYTLKEIKAPAGYNLNGKDVSFTVTDGNVTLNSNEGTEEKGEDTAELKKASEDDPDSWILTVKNKRGTLLPDTGGSGTFAFYLAGGLAILAAVILMLRRKKV